MGRHGIKWGLFFRRKTHINPGKPFLEMAHPDKHSYAFIFVAGVVLLIGGFLLFSGENIPPRAPEVTVEMQSCQTNADCSIITTPSCCPCPIIALNSSSASRAFESQRETYCSYLNEKEGGITCLAYYCGEISSAFGQCVNNRCEARVQIQ